MKKILILNSLLLSLVFCGCSTSTDSNTVKEFNYEEIDSSSDLDTTNTIEAGESNAPSNEFIPTALSELDGELELIEIESTFILDRCKTEDLTTRELEALASDLYKLWDDELNSIWSRFWDAADRETKDSTLIEQREWIALKEARSKEEASKYSGGSLYGYIKLQSQAKLTRLRTYELASYLGKLTGQAVTLPSVNYDGFYVDTQGTMEAYSDLTITKAEDDFYDVEIGLYRLTTLSGYATLENGILKFTDETINANITGDIVIDNDTASFTVTSSDWEYLHTGDYFSFDEKWD